MTVETIDGEAEEVGTELVPAPAGPPPNLFRTDDPVEVIAKATSVADALKDVIVQKELFTVIQGKAHVNVGGWTLLGNMLGITAVVTSTEKVDNGWKAHVEARTMDGRVVGAADALCTKDEKRGPWKNADEYARLSMAQTRATSKALKAPLGFIVNLAGYSETPAEEMTFAEPDPPKAETTNGTISPKQLADLRKVYKQSGASESDLRMALVAAGVQNTTDLRAAMSGLTTAQYAHLLEAFAGVGA